jgi:hypothetical protein
VTLFHVSAGESLEVPVVIETVLEELKVEGRFEPGKLLNVADGGYYAAAILDVGMEPTNHVLHDIAEEKAVLEAWGRPIFLVATSQAQLDRLNKEITEGRYGELPSNVRLAVDEGGKVLDALVSNLDLKAGTLPIFIIGDTFDKVYFASQGYTIGMGEQIQGVLNKL